MNWIKIKHFSREMPIDGKVFLSMWKGRICLTQFDTEEQRFYIVFDPAEYDHCMQVCQEREGKFTHWMPLPEEPIYPDQY